MDVHLASNVPPLGFGCPWQQKRKAWRIQIGCIIGMALSITRGNNHLQNLRSVTNSINGDGFSPVILWWQRTEVWDRTTRGASWVQPLRGPGAMMESSIIPCKWVRTLQCHWSCWLTLVISPLHLPFSLYFDRGAPPPPLSCIATVSIKDSLCSLFYSGYEPRAKGDGWPQVRLRIVHHSDSCIPWLQRTSDWCCCHG